jgi:hypothetical protein
MKYNCFVIVFYFSSSLYKVSRKNQNYWNNVLLEFECLSENSAEPTSE